MKITKPLVRPPARLSLRQYPSCAYHLSRLTTRSIETMSVSIPHILCPLSRLPRARISTLLPGTLCSLPHALYCTASHDAAASSFLPRPRRPFGFSFSLSSLSRFSRGSSTVSSPASIAAMRPRPYCAPQSRQTTHSAVATVVSATATATATATASGSGVEEEGRRRRSPPGGGGGGGGGTRTASGRR